MEISKTLFKEQQSENFVAFFLSDLHLSLQSLEHIQTLEDWVDSLLKSSRQFKIFFLGDVFDLWVGCASPVKKQVQPLLNKLYALQTNGSEVFFFEGNHDIHLSKYFHKKWGFEVVPEKYSTKVAGLSLHLQHGDLFDPEDRGYLFLRRFLRLSVIRFLILYIVPNSLINGVGSFFSKKSSKRTRQYTTEHTQIVQSKLKTFAKAHLQKDESVLICGHTHQRCILDLNERQSLINLGTWQKQQELQVLALSEDQSFKWVQLTSN